MDQEWRDIATAPRHMSVLLYWYEGGPNMGIGHFSAGRWRLDVAQSIHFQPSHWMPLPDRPNA